MYSAMRRVLFALLGLFVFGACVGCQALNDDPNNKRCWFPSLMEPGHLNPAHEKYTPEGSDPFPNANIGPKAVQARPQYWENPRDWNRDVNSTPSADLTIDTTTK